MIRHTFVILLSISILTVLASSGFAIPNVLWIMLDDGRADALGCYGAPWAKTPNLDALAANGVRFETAVVQNPVCTPARTCMKTGLYAHQTGVIAMGKPATTPAAYQKDVRPELPHLLQGWIAAGVRPVNIGKVHAFQSDFNHIGDLDAIVGNDGSLTPYGETVVQDNSFQRVFTDLHKWMIGGVVAVDPKALRPSRLGEMAVKQIRELGAANKPFFLRVSFHSPHVANVIDEDHFIDPSTINLPLPTAKSLASKSTYEREHIRVYAGATLNKEQIGIARGTYYGMVHLVDDAVGRIIAELKEQELFGNTIIAVNSDQGFQLGEHGVWKKRDFYDTNVCIPMFFHYPKALPTGKVIEAPIESIDFLPTLLDLCELEAPNNIEARSLLPLIRGEAPPRSEAVFSEHDHSADVYEELRDTGGRRVMVRTMDWKLVFFMDERRPEKDGVLYDLKNDPGETMNLYNNPKNRATVLRLEELAVAWDKRTR
jgi:arylsulfatase A-like enzyme